MNFSEDIKHALVDKKMNPSELARTMGYSPQYIINVLNGERRWNETTMKRVCEVLGLEIKVVIKNDAMKEADSSE